MTLEQKIVLVTSQYILKQRGVSVSSPDLQQMFVWATRKDPSITSQTVYKPETWEGIGVKLLDISSKGVRVARNLEKNF